MFTSFRRTIIATTALIGLTAFPVLAQTQAAPAPTPAPAAQVDTNANHRMAGRVEARITDLHKKLKITAEQQKPWDDFAQVMRNNATRMDGTFQHRVQGMAAMTADQSMTNYAQLAAQHAQDMQALVPVFGALYATMSEAQKQTADQVFRAEAHDGKHARRG